MGPEPQVQDGTYPADWEFDSLLFDGRGLHVRPVRSTDTDALISFYEGLSPHALRLRFLDVAQHCPRMLAEQDVTVDYRARITFLALVAERVVGVGSFSRAGTTASSAEVAFLIADEFQHKGVATILLETLTDYGRGVGLSRFVAEVSPSNTLMLEVFRRSGLGLCFVPGPAGERVLIDLEPTAAYLEARDAREATAEAASIAPLLQPASVAVVGASRQPGHAGHEIVRSLLSSRFAGTVYPVNPHATSICGSPAFANLESLPAVPEHVVIAVPADQVLAVVREASALGVRAATIITAGFGELGGGGAVAESSMLEIARQHGMRVVGPNCLGIVNTDPAVRLFATFADLVPAPGPLALISQSGALGIVLAREAQGVGLGLSKFVSVGNKLDVSSNDLLCYLERDEKTSIIALYLESFGNPRKFARIARRIAKIKPIIALKAGKSVAGARGARSHTAAAATPEVVVAALLRQSGVIQVDRLEQVLDVASVLSGSDLPAGRRVAIVGNSGGPMILASDACEERDLEVPEFDDALKQRLRALLGSTAAVANPVDLTAEGTPERLRAALRTVLSSGTVDAVLVVVTDLFQLSVRAAREVIEELDAKIPVLSCLFGAPSPPDDAGAIVEIPTPERAADALARVVSYSQWRDQHDDQPAHPVRDRVALSALLDSAGSGWLSLDRASELLDVCGLPVVRCYASRSADEAVAIAEQVGFPVALKVRSGELVHKSEAGGVLLGLSSAAELRDAFAQLSARFAGAPDGLVVQAMAQPGLECIVGVASDPVFGPVVMVGLGGIATDLLGDRSFAVPPISHAEARRMIDRLRSAPLLDGYRGAPRVGREALEEILVSVGQLAEDLPELAELDCNPVVLIPGEARIVDCKVRVERARLGPGALFRALRRRL